MAKEEVVVVPKPGWRTTEFYLTILSNILPFIAGVLPSMWQVIFSAVTVAAYSISRGLAKSPPDIVVK